ncbi:MAG: hypothetical protein JSS76_18180 [Bacteroidetes bacterium]|nr:hypothetical protein [Bacteroidota bacterium]
MRRKHILLLLAAVMALASCKKPVYLPPAVVSVQLTSSEGNTSVSDTVGSSYTPLHIFTFIDSTAYPASDSINLVLHSSLTSNGPVQNYVQVKIDFDHVFARSAVTCSDEFWDFYNLNDVINVLRGPLTPMRHGVLQNNTINISLIPPGSNDLYRLADAPDGAAASPVVTYVGEDYDWYALVNSHYFPQSSNSFRPQLFRVTYSGQLVCAATADTMTVQNLIYQGFVGNNRY